MEDEQARARRSLAERFRQERAELESRAATGAQQGKKPGWRPSGRLIAVVVILLVLAVIAVPVAIVGAKTLDRLNMEDSVRHFCAAEAEGDYATAYQLLSRRLRAQLSQDQFAATVQQAHLLDCATSQNARRFTVQEDHASLGVSLLIGDAAGGSNQQDSGTMALVNEDGAWYVDGITGSQGPLLG